MKGNSGKIFANLTKRSGKIIASLTKPWQKRKTAYYHSGIDKVVRFLKGDQWW
jgi:hypothetical protein